MAEAQVQRTAQDQGRDKGRRPILGEGARQRLLADMPVTERRLLLAGISTAVLEGGEGPPVVLLHGPMGNATHWMGIIPGLVATHRVIVPDLPGHGISEVTDDGRIDADRVMEWLGGLIEQSCVTPPAVVGQLLGGAIAARFAIDHGDRLSQLVLVDTFGLREFQPAPEFGLALRAIPRAADRGHAPGSLAVLRIRSRWLAPADGGALGAVRGLQPRSRPHAERAGRSCRPHGAVRRYPRFRPRTSHGSPCPRP